MRANDYIKMAAYLGNVEVKYFTDEMEKELINLCREGNGSETIIDKIYELMERVASKKFVFRVIISRGSEYYKEIVDFRNYEADIITRIFEQARRCDVLYGAKIEDYSQRISNSSKLLSRLASSIDLCNIDSKSVDCSKLQDTLDEFLSSNIDLYYADEIYTERSIERYIAENDADCFDGFSKDIYAEFRIQDEANYPQNKLYKDEELQYVEAIDLVLDKGTDKPIDELIEKALEKALKDEKLVSMVAAVLDETGITDYVKGYVKIRILLKMEKELRARYKAQYVALQEKIASGIKTDEEEINAFVGIVNALIVLEKRIQKQYAEMHSNNLSIGSGCNERINRLEEINIYKDTTGVMTDQDGSGPILKPVEEKRSV